MIQIDREKLKIIFKECYSYNDVCLKHCGYSNGKAMSKMRNFAFNNAVDTSHFDNKNYTTKYELIEKVCPVCFKNFTTRKGHPREKETCSYGCSNTYFRSGEDNGGYKEIDELDSKVKYVRICFNSHVKKCIICGEQNIVSVHHYDENHKNDEPSNLVPMCQTHHQYMHSRFAYLIKDKVDTYVINWKLEHGKLAESV
jgi:hypothetical protein